MKLYVGIIHALLHIYYVLLEKLVQMVKFCVPMELAEIPAIVLSLLQENAKMKIHINALILLV